MADQQSGHRSPLFQRDGSGSRRLLLRIQDLVTNSGQLVGFLALAISGAILLFLTGVTLAGAILCFIFLAPILLFTSPVWCLRPRWPSVCLPRPPLWLA
ncbi:hypothetical protein HPP92_023392 [Vanilla planifolia]|uniref:Uncharacterized protein n=1 Tax=Vanilla planifolia TaxID=51239 RepID=A0A835PT94_VANPL|nr:hypothetical protein HPP92_023392 [Vanilla planifolia]